MWNRFFKYLYTLTYFVSIVPMKLYDLFHGTEFTRIEKTDEEDGRYSYFPSSVFTFPFLNKYIRRKMQGGRGHSVLDIGCGKGLVLLFFGRLHFDKVAGIEYNKNLSALARINLDKVSGRATVYEGDAASFSMYQDYDVYYLYNPFDRTILEKCLDRILSSLGSAPRTLTVFYCNPVYGDVLKKKGFQEAGHFYYKTTVFTFTKEK